MNPEGEKSSSDEERVVDVLTNLKTRTTSLGEEPEDTKEGSSKNSDGNSSEAPTEQGNSVQ